MRFLGWVGLGLILSGVSCSKKYDTPKAIPTAKVEAPAKILTAPFDWGISVRNPDDKTQVYEPAVKGERIPMGAGSRWRCMHMGLQTREEKGSYIETRDVMCRLPGGEAVMTRTACVRHADGKVETDSQVLMVLDEVQHLIVVKCLELEDKVEKKEPDESKASDDQNEDVYNPPTSTFL